jgi:hypothetical protein
MPHLVRRGDAGEASDNERLANWLFAAVAGRPTVQLGLVRGRAVPLETAAPELTHQPE